LLATPRSCYCGGEMLAVSGTVVNASVNLTRRVVATHESEWTVHASDSPIF